MSAETPLTCTACGQANRGGRKFCGGCGAALQTGCPACGAEIEAGTSFCGECGGALHGSAPAVPSAPAQPATPAAPAQGTSFASGRYQVKRFIGEGAKKRVYLATDTRLASDVAFAMIKTEGLDADGTQRVRREVEAMGRLRDHPHIVAVFDVGDEDGQPYIVSQYMAAGDVEGLLRAAPERRLPVNEALRIAGQVTQALEHAHGMGVVHRDLKPGNVWLAADSTAKLGDFGLAISAERSRLTQEGTIVGTVSYMPPEQALGKPPDARSDLYALGAMLYEMVTGRPPFVGDDAVAIISQHINTPPVAPSWHNPDVAPPLEKLILALLAKDPVARPADASTVRGLIERVESGEPVEETKTAAHPLDRLAEGVFVGREDEIAQLRRGTDAALATPGRVLMLVGEPGIGKTRTAEEVVTYARMRGAQVLWGRCYEGEGAPAFWPWRQIIRAYVHERDPQQLASEMGAGAADIAEVVSEVRERLPGLPEAAKLDAEQARFRLFDSITTFLRNASQREPLVLVLDDLHWADKPSLLLLQFVARQLAEMRMLVLGTYRDVELSRQHPLAETLAELTRSQLCERVLLRGLQETDVERYVSLATGREPPPHLVEAIYRETEGNPFFVSEVVRLLESDGRLARAEEVKSWSVEIPQGVREVIGRRLNGLSEECNRVLTLASILGREFELREIESFSELSGDPLLEILETAVDAHVLDEMPEAVGRYRFSHALIRETLYDELSTTRRVRLHRQAGEALETIHAANIETHLAPIAHHFCEGAPGGDIDKAVHYAIRAAERAEVAHAYEERALQFEKAISAFELKTDADPWAHCVLLLGLGISRFLAGDTPGMKSTFLQVIREARAFGDPERLARAMVAMPLAADEAGLVDDEVVSAYEEALAGIEDADLDLRARISSRLGLALYFSSDRERMHALTREGLAMARQTGDDEALLEAILCRGIAIGTHDAAERASLGQERLELAERVDDRQAQLSAHEFCTLSALELGDIEAYRRHCDEVERLTDETRQHQLAWNAISHRACLAVLDGRFDEGESLCQEILTKTRGENPAAIQAYGALMVAMRRLQGRSTEVEPVLLSMVEQYPTLANARAGLARGYAEQGREADARRELEFLKQGGLASIPVDVNWMTAMALLSEVAHFLGDQDAAAELYDLLLPLEGRYITIASIVCSGAAARYLGVAAEALGRFDDAERHYEKSLELNRAIGARAHTAATLAHFGRMSLRRGNAGDHERAIALLNEAQDQARELGLKGILEEILALRLEAQGVDSSDTQHSIYTVASAVQQTRPDVKPATADDGSVTIMFSDMEGFTTMTERLGDVAAHQVVSEHNAIVREQLAAHNGHELELQGDGFLLAFASPHDGLRCAVAIQRAFQDRNAGQPGEPLRVRIGLHAGEAIVDSDKFFGLTVILAARIAAKAKGEEVLVSAELAERAAGTDLRLGAERALELKGISEPQLVVELDWR